MILCSYIYHRRKCESRQGIAPRYAGFWSGASGFASKCVSGLRAKALQFLKRPQYEFEAVQKQHPARQ
jgi:hypothetical protein